MRSSAPPRRSRTWGFPPAHHVPGQLSGGEQQRVALARALGGQPQILFADEPTGNLDGETGKQIIDLIFGLHRRTGTTLVLITHDAKLAARCERTVVITMAGSRAPCKRRLMHDGKNWAMTCRAEIAGVRPVRPALGLAAMPAGGGVDC